MQLPNDSHGRVSRQTGMPRAALRALLTCATLVGLSDFPASIATRTAGAQEQSVLIPERECKVKYVYLYSFALLTRWPARAFDQTDDPFVIGVLGQKPFGRVLDEIARRKRLSGRRIVIRRFQNMEEYKPCHILYVTRTVPPEEVPGITQTLENQSVLLVGETPDFEKSGGVIGFEIESGNVKFNLNMKAARQRHLVITARLSRLANRIVTGVAAAVSRSE